MASRPAWNSTIGTGNTRDNAHYEHEQLLKALMNQHLGRSSKRVAPTTTHVPAAPIRKTGVKRSNFGHDPSAGPNSAVAAAPTSSSAEEALALRPHLYESSNSINSAALANRPNTTMDATARLRPEPRSTSSQFYDPSTQAPASHAVDLQHPISRGSAERDSSTPISSSRASSRLAYSVAQDLHQERDEDDEPHHPLDRRSMPHVHSELQLLATLRPSNTAAPPPTAARPSGVPSSVSVAVEPQQQQQQQQQQAVTFPMIDEGPPPPSHNSRIGTHAEEMSADPVTLDQLAPAAGGEPHRWNGTEVVVDRQRSPSPAAAALVEGKATAKSRSPTTHAVSPRLAVQDPRAFWDATVPPAPTTTTAVARGESSSIDPERKRDEDVNLLLHQVALSPFSRRGNPSAHDNKDSGTLPQGTDKTRAKATWQSIVADDDPTSGATSLSAQRYHAPQPVFIQLPPATPGFNDPRLIRRLNEAIQARHVVESLAVLLEEAHDRFDLICPTEESEFKQLVLQFSFETKMLECDERHVHRLDQMLILYSASDLIPNVLNAVVKKTQRSELERKEVQDATQATAARYEKEWCELEQERARTLQTIRMERTELMWRIQRAEEERAVTLAANRDRLIARNFAPGLLSDSPGQGRAFSATALSTHKAMEPPSSSFVVSPKPSPPRSFEQSSYLPATTPIAMGAGAGGLASFPINREPLFHRPEQQGGGSSPPTARGWSARDGRGSSLESATAPLQRPMFEATLDAATVRHPLATGTAAEPLPPLSQNIEQLQQQPPVLLDRGRNDRDQFAWQREAERLRLQRSQAAASTAKQQQGAADYYKQRLLGGGSLLPTSAAGGSHSGGTSGTVSPVPMDSYGGHLPTSAAGGAADANSNHRFRAASKSPSTQQQGNHALSRTSLQVIQDLTATLTAVEGALRVADVHSGKK